jgi:acetyl-CoA synthetase
MVITSDGGYRGNKTIALKEIIESVRKMHIVEKVLLKEPHSITMKEGDIWLQPLLDEASDNSVAEIMDSDPYSFYIPWFDRKTERNGTYHRLYMVYTAYTFKNVFNYEENDIFGVRLILVGLQVILILYVPY